MLVNVSPAGHLGKRTVNTLRYGQMFATSQPKRAKDAPPKKSLPSHQLKTAAAQSQTLAECDPAILAEVRSVYQQFCPEKSSHRSRRSSTASPAGRRSCWRRPGRGIAAVAGIMERPPVSAHDELARLVRTRGSRAGWRGHTAPVQAGLPLSWLVGASGVALERCHARIMQPRGIYTETWTAWLALSHGSGTCWWGGMAPVQAGLPCSGPVGA